MGEGGGGGGESGLSHLSKRLYRRGLGQLEILGSKSFFRWDLKTLCIKNSENESQAKKKMILILIAIISHFWSPCPTHFR